MKRAHSEMGMSLIEVTVLFVAAGFFVVAAAPLFSRFLATRASMDYTLRATLLAQDIMERIRGKSFEDLEDKANSTLSMNDIKAILYDESETFPSLPPGAEILLKIQQESSDLLIVEVEVTWKEILRIAMPTSSPNPQERSYRVATYVYRHGIQELHKVSGE